MPLITSPAIEPSVPPSPTLTVPDSIVVGPVKVLFAVRDSIPVPACTRAPVPEIVPAKATSSDRSKRSVPPLTTSPAIDPMAPPSPICSVPAAIVVGPE